MGTFALDWQEDAPEAVRGGALAIGNFDGVHRGHGALVGEVVRQAAQCGGPAVVVGFDPHPLKLLRPEEFQPVLTTAQQRAALLHGLGAVHVVFLKTSPALLQLGASDFFESVIRGRLDARALVEGPNFRFGHDRAGDVALLQTLCEKANMRLSMVPTVLLNGQPVSSSRVRRALLGGDVGEAARLLAGERIRRVPVIKHGKMVGLLSRSDVLDFFAKTRWTCSVCGRWERGLERPERCFSCSSTDIHLERADPGH